MELVKLDDVAAWARAVQAHCEGQVWSVDRESRAKFAVETWGAERNPSAKLMAHANENIHASVADRMQRVE